MNGTLMRHLFMVNETSSKVTSPMEHELEETVTNPLTTPRYVTLASISQCLRPAESRDELGRLAHFKVTRVLGQGGMGMVFEAIDLQLNRAVALKVIHPETQDNPK